SAPRPRTRTFEVRWAVCPSRCATVTRALPQHSSISRYMLFYMQPADRWSAAPRRHAVKQDGGLDLLMRKVVLAADRATQDALTHKIGDQANRHARAFDDGLAGQHAGAALDHVALGTLEHGEVLARGLLQRRDFNLQGGDLGD